MRSRWSAWLHKPCVSRPQKIRNNAFCFVNLRPHPRPHRTNCAALRRPLRSVRVFGRPSVLRHRGKRPQTFRFCGRTKPLFCLGAFNDAEFDAARFGAPGGVFARVISIGIDRFDTPARRLLHGVGNIPNFSAIIDFRRRDMRRQQMAQCIDRHMEH